jgi:Family of unknown function (DUF6290)
MNEKERAAFHQAHKDDPSVWGDAEERDPPRQRRGLNETISVRLSAEESNLLRRLAEAIGVSYSEIMRKALKAYAGSGRQPEDRVWTMDYHVFAKPTVPRPSIEYGDGFNQGPMSPTDSRRVF